MKALLEKKQGFLYYKKLKQIKIYRFND